MEKRKLQSMVGYVLEKEKEYNDNDKQLLDCIFNHASFLSMPLTEEIILNYFKGFYKHHGVLYFPNQVDLINLNEDSFTRWHTIEWLINNSFQEIYLTESAINKYQI